MKITKIITAIAVAAVAVVGISAANTPASASSHGATVVSNYAEGWHHGRVRPATIYFGQGGSPILGAIGSLGGKLRWQYWRQGSAYAQGKLWAENCIPNCAQARYHSRWVSVRLTHVRAHGSHNWFTRMAVKFHRHGRWHRQHLVFKRYCAGGSCGTVPMWIGPNHWPYF